MKPRLRTKRIKAFLLPAAIGGLLALGAAPASGADFVPGQVIVNLGGTADQVVKLPPNVDVKDAAAALNANPAVSYAAPNYLASVDSFPATGSPNDRGSNHGAPGDWKRAQWNFLTPTLTAPGGVDAIGAWNRLGTTTRPGAKGVRIAVIDTGVAYRRLGRRFRRSPDFNHTRFGPGYDFVGHDKYPLDLYGHGTHVTGTIAESTNNGIGVTGLAYASTILPVRVLNRNGTGSAANVAKGIRWAADHHAKVINMSFDFPASLGKQQLPGVYNALSHARNAGALLVASAGNHAKQSLPYPARAPQVISVAATTKSGCLANYSNWGGKSPGQVVDIAAPGGGDDAPGCPPSSLDGPQIRQYGFNTHYSGFKHFRLVSLEGTSQAAPHISGIVALVIARRIIGTNPSRSQMVKQLQDTGTAIAAAAYNSVIRVNATAATAP